MVVAWGIQQFSFCLTSSGIPGHTKEGELPLSPAQKTYLAGTELYNLVDITTGPSVKGPK